MEEQPERRVGIPIGVVARRTGLSPGVLRAWERRYGAARPGRSEGGVRLYSSAEVARLTLLARAVAAGHAIGRLVALPSAEIEALLEESARGNGVAPGVGQGEHASNHDSIDAYVRAGLEAVHALDDARLHGILTRAAVVLRGVEFAEGVVAPLLRRVGELWVEGDLCPAHEHMLSAQVRRVLTWLLDNLAVPEGAPRAVASTPKGHAHELAALLAAVRASEVGWRVTYLGPDLPANDIALAAVTTGARVVLLSVVRETGGTELVAELRSLRQRLTPDVTILVGGSGALRQRREIEAGGGVWLSDLRNLGERLQAMIDVEGASGRVS